MSEKLQGVLNILNAAPVDNQGRICLTAEAAQEIALALQSHCEQEPSEEQVEEALELADLALGTPWTFGYSYPDGIRFDTGGSTINGSRPRDSWPLYGLKQIHSAIRAAIRALKETK